MRLSRVVIRNFKSIDHIEFRIPETDSARPGSADFLSIVGKNNVGKSTILQAIQAACPGGGSKLSIECFPNCIVDPDRYPEVELHFDNISQADRQQHAIGAHIISDTYSIKKQWQAQNSGPTPFVFRPEFVFRPDPDSFTTFGDLRAHPLWNQVLGHHESTEGVVKDNAKLKKSEREALKRLAVQIGSGVAHQGEANWQLNPGGFQSNLDKVLPEVIFVPAVQQSKEATDSSKKTTALARIIRRIFETSLVDHHTVVAYHEAAKGLEALFTGESRDSIVTDIENRIRGRIRELIDVIPALGFAPPDIAVNFVNSTELRFSDANTNASVAAEHHGHGAQRAIIISLLQVMSEIDDLGARPLLFLIEEPEIYLHPEMCRKMRDALIRIARAPTAQVICTTHSPTFLDLADRHDGILLLRRNLGKLSFHQSATNLFSGSDAKDQCQRLRMILNFDASVNEVFFADRVVLVEGDTEIAALDSLGRRLCDSGEIDETEYNIRRRTLKVVNCRGKWTIVSFQRVLEAFRVPYLVVHDEDPAKAGATQANSRIFVCLDEDENRRMVHSPDFETQHFGAPADKDKPWAAYQAITGPAPISPSLRRYFEFMLECRISDLKKKKKTLNPGKGSGALNGRRRNRPQLQRLQVDPSALTPYSLVEFLAGADTNVIAIETLDRVGFRYKDDVYGTLLIARAQGNSSQSPLLNSCEIILKRENFTLPRAKDADRRIGLREFHQHITQGSIHLIAINDDIDRGVYCVRRVLTERLVDGNWNCRITVDRPVKGRDVDKVIRHYDRVHFLAEVIAITTLPPDTNAAGSSNPVQLELGLAEMAPESLDARSS